MTSEKLQKYALVAEIVGGIAVLVTLVILILQVRDNTNVIRSQELNSLRTQFIETHKFLAEHADLHAKSLHSPEELTLEETIVLAQYYFMVSIPMWQYWESYLAGVVTEEDMEEALVFAPSYYSVGLGRAIWEESRSGYPSDFVQAIEERVNNSRVSSDLEYYQNVMERVSADGT